MDLSTNYLGLKLQNPIVVSSSKLTGSFANIKKCADFGAGAVVMQSLFEEQLLTDPNKLMEQDDNFFWYPDAIDHINKYSVERGLNDYLDIIQETKAYTRMPVIASIHCKTRKEWPKYAKKLEEAGADALELNIYIFPFDKELNSNDIEEKYVEIVKEVKQYVNIPVAVKIGYGFTNVLRLTSKLEDAGANGLVVFNRFYRPDIDVENERVVRANVLSDPSEITQALRWIVLLSGELKLDLAGSRGIHDANGIVKMLLAGADVTQICSAFFIHGLGYIDTLLFDLQKWMEKHFYTSVSEFQGKISKGNVSAFEQFQYNNKSRSKYIEFDE